MRRGDRHQARSTAECTLPYRLDQPRERPNAFGFVPESNLKRPKSMHPPWQWFVMLIE